MVRKSSRDLLRTPEQFRSKDARVSENMAADEVDCEVTPYDNKIALNMPDVHPTDKEYMTRMLRKELENFTVDNEPIDDLLQRLFPVDRLPYKIDDIFNFVSGKDYVNGKWIFLPQLDKPLGPGILEKKVSNFLESLVMAIDKSNPSVTKPKRNWTSEFSELPLSPVHNFDIARKLDILALSPDVLKLNLVTKLVHLKWLQALLLVELKAGKNSQLSNLMADIINKIFCMFQAQWNRRFIVSLGILRYNFYVSVFSRAGAVHSVPFDINNNPKTFIHLIIGLNFCDNSLIGFDDTFKIDNTFKIGKSNQLCSMMIGGEEYFIKEECWRSYCIQGRATQCFIIYLIGGKFYVVKDVNILRSRKPTEAYFYRKANKAGVRNIPTLLSFENVYNNGVKDTCEIGTNGVPLHDRIHRRYIFAECGVPMWEFKSLRELISALIDIVTTHYDLYKKAGILHRDISIWNMMLRIDPSLEPLQQALICQGLLIDLDYAFNQKPSPKVEDTVDSENENSLLPDDEQNFSYENITVLNTPSQPDATSTASSPGQVSTSQSNATSTASSPEQVSDNALNQSNSTSSASSTGSVSAKASKFNIPEMRKIIQEFMDEYGLGVLSPYQASSENTASVKSGESGYVTPADTDTGDVSDTTVCLPTPSTITGEDIDDRSRLLDLNTDVPVNTVSLSDEKNSTDSNKKTTAKDKNRCRGKRGHHTGTHPFIAAEVLQLPKIKRTIAQDLESFFYVIMYMCTKYTGPNGQTANVAISALPAFLVAWFFDPNYLMVGAAKWGILTGSELIFEEQYLVHFSKYFTPLRDCVKKLCVAIADKTRKITHEIFLGILEETLASLPKNDPEPEVKINSKKSQKRCHIVEDISDLVPFNLNLEQMRVTTVGEDLISKRRKVDNTDFEDPFLYAKN